MRAQLAADFERFKVGCPRDLADYIRDAYRIDLTARYLGHQLPHPIGKASGQLSLRADQLETDSEAGLAFVVLKTLIAEDETGKQSMCAWAIHETRMQVERVTSQSGSQGWTVTWKGRGWDRSLDEYLGLLRSAREITRAGGPLIVPSVKYHLPRKDEPFHLGEYAHTTTALARAWGEGDLLIEKDFSPTLAGDSLAEERENILRWTREIPRVIQVAAPHQVRVALKLMNSRFDDDFQIEMLRAAGGAQGATVFTRLYDTARGVAYGGYDLSDRNLRVLDQARSLGVHTPVLSGTGNIGSGRMILDYARRGCESVQLHTYFQLPLTEYPATAGSRSQRAMHALLFDPENGLIAGLLELERQSVIAHNGGELRFLDVTRVQ